MLTYETHPVHGARFVYKVPERRQAELTGVHNLVHMPKIDAPGEAWGKTWRLENRVPVGDDNPFQVLHLYNEGDENARAQLVDLYLEYRQSHALNYSGDFPVPEGKEFFPYQKAGIAYGLRRRNVLIGDAPGLGKTMQAIGLANAWFQKERDRLGDRTFTCVVVCPASVRLQWGEQILGWSTIPGTQVKVIQKPADPKQQVALRDTHIILSYEGASHKAFREAISGRKIDVLVLDEAHYLKNHEAKRTISILGSYDQSGDKPLIASADHTVALSGTPLPNRPRECYTLARAMCPEAIHNSDGSIMSFDQFSLRFNPNISTKSGFKIDQSCNEIELQNRLRSMFMVRRLKEDVIKDLPDKFYEVHTIDENAQIRAAVKAEKLLDIDVEALDILKSIGNDMEKQAALATARKMIGIASVPAMIRHVDMLLDGAVEKVVLFVYHREVIAQLLDHFGGRAVTIHGSVSMKGRENAKREFINNPAVKVFVGQLTASGTGVDGLQNVCSHVVFGEPSWVAGENEQCIDRVHRIGQTAGVVVQFLVAPGSLTQTIINAAVKKLRVVNKVLDRKPGT